ncbi:hypothetical protein [Burkholderia ubonensis]|uniref:hypothetical protein n=1 Tax=Burkholderia ubonensis TaxID=101571 RepID=UPI0008FDA478|nr:hypothetical protein [Burkholderia ubonensis]
MASRSTTVILENKTDFQLTLDSDNVYLDHGEWTKGMNPPATIVGQCQGAWENESDGLLTGDQGHVRYTITDGETDSGGQNKNWVQINWDNPYGGDNSYDQSVSDKSKYTITRNSNTGSGNNATVKFSLTKAN